MLRQMPRFRRSSYFYAPASGEGSCRVGGGPTGREFDNMAEFLAYRCVWGGGGGGGGGVGVGMGTGVGVGVGVGVGCESYMHKWNQFKMKNADTSATAFQSVCAEDLE